MVKGLNQSELSISQSLRGGGTFSIICREANVTFTGLDGQGQPLPWAWDMVGGARQESTVQDVAVNRIIYRYAGVSYELKLSPGAGCCKQLPSGTIRLVPNSSGALGLILAATTRA